MKQYMNLSLDILMNGEERPDRTGTGTLSVFDRQLKFNLQDGFPLVTVKKTNIAAVIHELIWMLKGLRDGNIGYLVENSVKIWNEWADEDGNLGPVYGAQWRNWPKYYFDGEHTHLDSYVDQLQNVIDTIKNNPTDRRMLVSAWNPGELDEMRLPPCHYAFQFYVRHGRYLDIKVHQRSADVFLGLPFDIASYATLTHMVAYLTNLKPGMMSYDLGDAHIYLNHIAQVHEMLKRRPKSSPQLHILSDGTIETIDDFRFEHFLIEGYDPHPFIKADVSV